MPKKLTPKRARFADEYMVDLNATQAAIRAGYSERSAGQTAFRLLKNDEIQERVTALRLALADRTEITVEEIVRRFDEVAQRCMQAEPVLHKDGTPVMVWTEDGEQAPAYTFNAAGANRALELLGKHLGAFVERHEITGKGGGPIAVADEKRLDVNDADDRAIIRHLVAGWSRVLQRWEDAQE